jgi:hypothetical protein
MIAGTIDDHYERIKGDLVSRGLTYDRLLDDLLDHVYSTPLVRNDCRSSSIRHY